MKKNLVRLLGISLVAAFIFIGCQKEQNLLNENQQVKGVAKIVPYNYSVPILKANVMIKKDSILIWDNNIGDYVFHKTRKFKDGYGHLQEWLSEDLYSNISTGTVYYYPGDNTGRIHGIYPQWYNNYGTAPFSNSTTNDWDPYMADKNYNSITGFHMPTMTDINKFVSIIGNTNLIRSNLLCGYDGTKNGGPDYSPNFAAFWLYLPGNPSLVPGCGVFAYMDKNNSDNLSLFFTNVPSLGVNVRLVRDITLSQW